MRLALALPLLLLAACASPREQCEARALRDLRVVDRLIEDSRATLERGYALETVETERLRYTVCLDDDGARTFCWVRDRDSETRPVAVNLNEIRATLGSLTEKREELLVRARRDLEACRALPDR